MNPMTSTTASILWRGLYLEGHEACQLRLLDPGWQLAGSAVFSHEQQPCRLDYLVVCDSAWKTQSGRVAGWLGNTPIDIVITVDSEGHWRLNGERRQEVAGCIDLDLNFSPSTNLLPIRRLGLAIGQEAWVNAAWLRFPSFALEPLEQRYHRIDETSYRYQSGSFAANLDVNLAGFVRDYPGIWQAEATT